MSGAAEGAGPLWRLDAVELARLVRTGAVSALDVVDAHLARMDAVNPTLNAVVLPLAEQARAAAVEADRARARGEALGPLHGVPVTIKCNVDQAGCPTDNGVVAYKDLIAQMDSPPVTAFRQAGAIIVGRTNTPAFSMRWFTDNALHGATANPWSAAHTPGGSSGGAASSVASGMVPIGHGNDIAGSVRYPAYCCGLVGLRPSYGRVAAFNPSAAAPRPISAQLMSMQGPLTRTVRDARLALAVMARRSVEDPKWVDVPLAGAPPARPIRVAMVEDPAGRGVRPEIAAAVRGAGQWLADAGYLVETIEPPELGAVADLWARIGMDDVIAALEPGIAAHGDAGIRRAVGFWRQGFESRGPQGVLDALVERERLQRLWWLFLESHPIVLMPSSGEQAFPVDLDLQDFASYQRIWNAQLPQLVVPVLGLPAVSVPTGVHGGLPLGVQIVSRRYREDLCLDAAEIIEARAGMRLPIDPR